MTTSNIVAVPEDAPDQGEKIFKYQWPPFPEPPKGKTIIPFKDFKPKGIIPADSDDEEFDGDGVATVKLEGITHFGDPAERAAYERQKRAKKRRKAPQGAGLGPANKKQEDDVIKWWYEDWEDNRYRERITPINPVASREDRFQQIITDFQTDRKFPRGVQSIYDNFRIFIGMLENVQNPAGSKGAKGLQPDEQSGDDMPDDAVDAGDESSEMEVATPEALPPSELPAEDSPPKRNGLFKKKKVPQLSKEDKLDRFLDDPESAMKIFFTSYSYERGMLWEEQKRINSPILIEFILDYIIRHGTMKDFKHQFEKAMKVAERAKIEQPALGEMANLMPDPFTTACTEAFGRCMDWGTWSAPPPEEPLPPAPEPAKIEEVVDVEPPPKVGLLTAEDLREEGLVLDDDDEAKVVDEDGWGTGADGWGNMEDAQPAGWGSDAEGSWNQAEPEWGTPPPTKSLSEYYGKVPDNFHIVRVERGLRQILSVEQPNPNSASEWRKPMGVVVLGPWPKPSSAPMTCTPFPTIEKEELEAAVTIPPHDPLTDVIRVYVDPETSAKLVDRIGMGFSAHWVQVAQKKVEDEGEVKPPPKKKSKSKNKTPDPDSSLYWWYCEDACQVVQTYWME